MLFPNPAKDEFTVRLAVADTRLESIEVITVTGKSVIMNNTISSAEAHINVSSLSAGIYIVRIQTDKGFSIQKLTIQ